MAKKTKKRYEDGGEIVVTGTRPASNPFSSYGNLSSVVSNVARTTNPTLSSSTGGSSGGSSGSGVRLGKVRTPAGNVYGVKGDTFGVGYNPATNTVGGNIRVPIKKGGEAKAKKMAKGGKLTDLTGDGKVTRADVLKGRGVPGFAKGGSVSKRADGCAQRGKTKGKMV